MLIPDTTRICPNALAGWSAILLRERPMVRVLVLLLLILSLALGGERTSLAQQTADPQPQRNVG